MTGDNRDELRQLSDEFEFLKGITFDINEDVRNIKASGSESGGFLHGAVMAIAQVIVVSDSIDAVRYLEGIRKLIHTLTSHNAIANNPGIEGAIKFFELLAESLAAAPGVKSALENDAECRPSS